MFYYTLDTCPSFAPGSIPTPLSVVAASYGFVDGGITKFSLGLYLSDALPFSDVSITNQISCH